MSYVTPTELKAQTLPAASVAGVSDAALQAHIDSACGIVNSYLRSQFGLPITLPTAEIKAYTSDIAAWRFMKWRGADPEDPASKSFVMAHNDAIAWLSKVAKGQLDPGLSTLDSTPGAEEGAPEKVGNDPRGW